MNAEIDNLKVEHRLSLARMESKHGQIELQLRQQYEQRLIEVNLAHQHDLGMLSSQMAIEREGWEQELMSTKSELDALREKCQDISQSYECIETKLRSSEDRIKGLNDEKENLMNSYQNQIQSLKSDHIKQLDDLRSSLSSEHQSRTESALRELKSSYESTIALMSDALQVNTTKLALLQNTIDSLKQEKENFVAETKNLSDRLNHSEASRTRLVAENDMLVLKLQNQMEESRKQHQQKLEEFKLHLEEENNIQIEEIKANYGREIAQLQIAMASKDKSLADIALELSRANETNENSISLIEGKLSEHLAIIEQQKNEIVMRKNQCDDLHKEVNDYKTQIQSSKLANEEYLKHFELTLRAQLKSDYETEKDVLKRETEAANKMLINEITRKFGSDREHALNELEAQHAKYISQLKVDHASVVREKECTLEKFVKKLQQSEDMRQELVRKNDQLQSDIVLRDQTISQMNEEIRDARYI
ncbi:hypothetical protein BKA69DRAFT_448644 [Paraphysoderma sedebokerense]|nr:hypothetical protein BKA69DRAFT_448644 [Paraphysoderma sedebokerense]